MMTFLNSPNMIRRKAWAESIWRGSARRSIWGSELAGAHDRAGDQVGEERQVGGEVEQATGWSCRR